MNSTNESPRFTLIRETATLQLKLIADGFRDAVLIPISLLAALIGLLRGGEDCDREFRRVIKLGRRSERWIRPVWAPATTGRLSSGRLNGQDPQPGGIRRDGSVQERSQRVRNPRSRQAGAEERNSATG
jgi:hypothetical protein